MPARHLRSAGVLVCFAWGCASTTTATARPDHAGAVAEGEDAAVSVTVEEGESEARASDEDGAARATVETDAASDGQPDH